MVAGYITQKIKTMIFDCVEESFETKGDFESTNRMLEEDKNWAEKHNVHYHPTITINNFTYRGNINYRDIREALCAAYTKKVGICDIQSILKDRLKPTELKVVQKQNPSNLRLIGAIGGIIFVLVNAIILTVI